MFSTFNIGNITMVLYTYIYNLFMGFSETPEGGNPVNENVFDFEIGQLWFMVDITIWLLVWNMNFIVPYIGNNNSN